MTDPYTQRPMEPARAGTDFRDNRFDGLHAEATAAVGYSANTLRSVRERYREAYSETLGRWQTLRDELGVRMAAAGHPLDASAGPVISNFPIWMAETQRIPTLALPDEPPSDVLDMAHSFDGTRYLILIQPQGKHWPADLEAGAPDADCFRPIELGPWTGDAGTADPLADVTAFEVVCP